MRVVAYSIKGFEKELLAKANRKKHDITLISNALSQETAAYAEGKDAIIIFTNDDVSAPVIHQLADLGIKYIATRSVGTDHIDRETAAERNIKIANVPSYSPQAIAEFAVTLALALNRKLLISAEQSRNFNFTIDSQIGFNFHKKTVGIVGLGHTGLAAASIFKWFGCRLLGFDPAPISTPGFIERIDLETLFKESDIISLHAALVPSTHHLINAQTISKMKKGVMLINTSRGALIKTEDALKALESGQIGYLGLDVYENEKGFFFFDHQHSGKRDPLLERLMEHPNVIVTPHQAFLTREAVEEIAVQTIHVLDLWQKDKCIGRSCACTDECKNAARRSANTSLNPS